MAGFIALTLTATAIDYLSRRPYGTVVHLIFVILRQVVVPMVVLVINMIVLREVRRASKHSPANLGQSTSSNSTVPTIMLITTSFLYVILFGTNGIIFLIYRWSSIATKNALWPAITVSDALGSLVFAYNFYVYLITGKQFRSELYKLFCCCSSSSYAAAVAPGDAWWKRC